ATTVGKPGSAFVGKIFMSGDFPKAKRGVQARYTKVTVIRPEGTRTVSSEIFVVCLGPRGGRPISLGRASVGAVEGEYAAVQDGACFFEVVASAIVVDAAVEERHGLRSSRHARRGRYLSCFDLRTHARDRRLFVEIDVLGGDCVELDAVSE